MSVKVTVIIALVNFCFIPFTKAQAPQGFNYQAIMHNAAGEVIADKQVGLRISILKDGLPVCVEVFSPTTNAYGLITLVIGSVNATDFTSINWSTGIFTIKIELDPENGTNYFDMGTSPLLSVPFALYAKKSENTFSGNYSDLNGKPDLSRFIEMSTSPVEGDMSYFNGTEWARIEKPADANSRYTMEWDFSSNRPTWKVKLPAITFGGTTLNIYPTDNSPGISWYNGSYVTTNARSVDDGQTNTELIVTSQGNGIYAAKLCDTLVAYGYDDWYLPSKNELNAIYQDKEAIGGFSSAFYWSSTEYNNTNAWGQDFTDGSQVSYGKYPTSKCRCVRK